LKITAYFEELTELLELGPLLVKPVRNLSLGERMKCEIAAALLHVRRLFFWMNRQSDWMDYAAADSLVHCGI